MSPPARDGLQRRTMASFAALGLPLAAMSMPITVYLPQFYTSEMGLSIAAVGLVFTLARLWDVFTDPVMGVLIDRFPSRWGRYKHWIGFALPLLCAATYMLYLPIGGEGSTLYLGGWLFILYIGYTMSVIAHLSWGATLAPRYDERSRLFGWRQIAVIAGMVIVLALPAAVDFVGDGSERAKLASMGLFVLVMFPLCALPGFLAVPDRRGLEVSSIPWAEAVRAIVQNADLRRLLIAELATGFASAASGALYIWIAIWIFELPQHASIALLFYFVASLVAMPLWMNLAYRFGKDRALRFALAYGICVKLSLLVVATPGSVVALWGFTIVYGVAYGAAPTLLRSMMADLTDQDELRVGERRSGLFFAVLSTIEKLGSALAVGVMFVLTDLWAGFVNGPGNSPETLQRLLFAYVAGPAAALGLAWFALRGYRLSRAQHDEVRAALYAREAEQTNAETATDAIAVATDRA